MRHARLDRHLYKGVHGARSAAQDLLGALAHFVFQDCFGVEPCHQRDAVSVLWVGNNQIQTALDVSLATLERVNHQKDKQSACRVSRTTTQTRVK